MKTDPISLLVYIIILILLYVFIGIIVSTFVMIMYLPFFSGFKKYSFTNNPVWIVFFQLPYKILYSVTMIVIMTIVFVIVLFFILVVYVIWKFLLTLGPIGGILIPIIPPIQQFKDAGIFDLIDNIISYLPLPFVKMSLSIFIEMISFSKDKIVDIAKAINPAIEIDADKIDEILLKIRAGDNVEKFENDKEKSKNIFVKNTEKSISQNALAEKYKSAKSISLDTDMSERMSTIFSNEFKKIQIELNNTPNSIKLNTSVIP